MPRLLTILTPECIVKMSLTSPALNGHRLNGSGRAEDISPDGHSLATDAAAGSQILAGVGESNVGMTLQRLHEMLLLIHRVLHRHGWLTTASIATVL